MNILISGGAGFIGSHLCEALINGGHNVVCADNLILGSEENIKSIKTNSRFSFYNVDIADIKAAAAIFKMEKINYVMHLAANSDIRASENNPDIDFKNTYQTTFSLLENMRTHGTKKMFFASSSAVYGDKPGIALSEETTGLSPASYYGAAKLGSEALVSAYCHMNDMSALIFRFPNVVGPRLTHGVIYDFIKKLRHNGKRLEILGDGNQKKPYMYVGDLINAIIRFMDLREGISLYNIGASTAISVKTIADTVCREMGLADVEYDYTGGYVGWRGDVARFDYALDKIYATGWRPSYTSEEAVTLTVREELSLCRQ